MVESSNNNSLNKFDLSEISIYLDADPAIALELYYALVSGVTEMQFSCPEQPQLKIPNLTGKNLITSAALSETVLSNTNGKDFYGLQLLQEYFCFREKFLFIELRDLEKLKLPDNIKKLEIKIISQHRFTNQTIAARYFKLNCATAINLFKKSSEPLRLARGQLDYKLIPDINNKNILLNTVNKVTGINEITGQKREYKAFHSFQHFKTDTPFYQLRLLDNKSKDFIYSLQLHEVVQAETLSCEITACNGNVPRQFLGQHMLTIAPDMPHAAKISNILRPSPLFLPPTRQNWRWELLAHLAFNLQAIQAVGGLQQLLRMYDWSGKLENQRRIEGINAIAIKPVRRLEKGLLLAGLEFKLAMKEENYLSIADIYLFGEILHRFFAQYAPCNTYVCTRLLCHPSNKEFVWQTSA